MKMRGEDTQAALRDWVKAEIKDGPKQAYGLGRFFFSVSAATIGAIAAIEKLNQLPTMDDPMIVCLILLSVSVLIAVDMARPRKHVIGGETDLLDEYSHQIRSAQVRTWLWLLIWVAGTICGAVAVRA